MNFDLRRNKEAGSGVQLPDTPWLLAGSTCPALEARH